MKLFNIGLALMIVAVIALPIVAVISPANRDFVLYAFYFCGLLELIGLIFVLVHIVTLKRKNP
ncbi:hypothetical protein H9N25_16950 [Pedobacter riviphilus]|uniref:Uncharacterized protein n=2 Tax=Pedobacter TaxID=84567 RepID=A0A366LAD8_9SPHI|nr:MULTISPECIES: hypothetical protein [Pedobacter]NII85716.1 Na+/melibiose symporter-like transporter [Pedobacter sp. SG908]NMN39366.1 Na+/melibiose symporter-like transporter [Pedobacter sp. SG918]QNR83622.1 hypothetical protein H9N25_16950 [Pedobacter riviphilus]RBQ10439.1 hypothetical protein DRW42_05290 [Pedobacter miscanthi]